MPLAEIRVEGVHSLAHGEAKVFKFMRAEALEEGFVLSHNGSLYAFHNRCPHWGVDLDMGEGSFYSDVAGYVFCRNHGALFEADTGRCVSGPCQGETLERFEVRRAGTGAVVIVPL